MWRGLYTAASGMITEAVRTDTLANNLANASTSGFKRNETVVKEFEPLLMRRINDPNDKSEEVTSFRGFSVGPSHRRVGTLGLGSGVAEIATDFSQGAMQSTGNPLDIAISGNGYLAVQTPQGIRYTREGNLFRAASGELQTVRGQAVVNQQSRPIVIPADARSVQFGAQGEVYVNGGQQIGRLQFVEFNDRNALVKQGNSLYMARAGANPQPATGEIVQGALEASNTNTVSEMVELINNYRIYEAGSKALLTQDSLLDKAVNDIGRTG
ncbi:MAG: flagellar hook-basal body protein [Selenomonadaceae bacterium]|nr:flagellar hook-basal body protein [Selenomonadaceae bacterium]